MELHRTIHSPTTMPTTWPSTVARAAPATSIRGKGPMPKISGVSVILCAALQALGAANSSLVVSLLRQLVLLFPLALLLGALRPSLVWLAFLLSEGAACLTALLLYRRTARGRLAGMEE